MTPSHWPRHSRAGRKLPLPALEATAASNLDRARLVRLAGDILLPFPVSVEAAGAGVGAGVGTRGAGGGTCCKLTNTGKR